MNRLVTLLLLIGSALALTAADKASSTDWWSLKPLVRPAVPGGEKSEVRSQNPVDAFIRAKLAEKQLTPSSEAEPRVLIRRLYFDLLGLPPKPEEVEAFVRECSPIGNRQSAIGNLVDRLLASPHYGERWAQHWLDVVHYGDTHGYDKDKPRPNAWPYRDYVIRAFNEDRPYARFIQEQVAGDVLFPGTRDGVEALGFIAAGPWDFIGHAEVPETKIDGKIARHLDRDDMVATTMQTFNSFTVGCAQCHDHKFDPITQREFYQIYAYFNSNEESGVLDGDGRNTKPVIGTPTAEQRKVWGEMRKGQDIAFATARIGTAAGAVDDAVRRYYESLGYGPDYKLPGLSHRTGHGIGMDGHEPINLVRGEAVKLAAGMCFSNEPGIYLPGKFGVRLEDCFHMTKTGPRWFSEPPKSIEEPIG